MGFSVRSAIVVAEQDLIRRILSKFQENRINLQNKNDDQLGILIKIIMTYFQIISTIFTFNLEFPQSFNLVNSVGDPIKQSLYSSDCF